MKVAVLGKVDQKGLSFLKENEFKVIEIENFEIQKKKILFLKPLFFWSLFLKTLQGLS